MRICRFIFSAFFVLSGIGAVRMFAQSTGSSEQAIPETIGFLRDLIRINTTNPPGNEIAAAAYLQRVFDREHIPCRVIEAAAGRASIVARVKGSGRARPIILMAHMDVVGVERDKWTFDPFAGELRDGHVLGRGAADDKAMLAANLELTLLLKRSGALLDRDIIYLGVAGEEGTPEFGINYLLERFPSEVDAEFALNEGGDVPLRDPNEPPLYAAVSTAEKTPAPVKLIARGTPGHGAFPSGNNAISRLAMAVYRVSQWQPPVRLNATTREFFRQIAELNLGEESEFARTIATVETQHRVQSVIPRYWAMSRTTISPTIFNAGFRTNAIPAEAIATLDIRLLPDNFCNRHRHVSCTCGGLSQRISANSDCAPDGSGRNGLRTTAGARCAVLWSRDPNDGF